MDKDGQSLHSTSKPKCFVECQISVTDKGEYVRYFVASATRPINIKNQILSYMYIYSQH